MPGDTTKYNIPFVAPALPYPTEEYDQRAANETNKVLRQYFNQLDNALRNIAGVDVPYDEQVARGEIPGASNITVFGYINDQGTSTVETIQYQGGRMVKPASAATVFVSSANTNDTSAGSGARTVLLEGLDANYNAVSETITLNGQTQVESSLSYIRLFKVEAVTVGSGGKNAGIVYVAVTGATSGVPDNAIYLVISADDNAPLNTSATAAYTVPAGHTLYIDLVQLKTDVRATVSGFSFVSLISQEFVTNGAEVAYFNYPLRSNLLNVDFPNYIKLTEKVDVELLTFSANSNTSEVTGKLTGVLIAN